MSPVTSKLTTLLPNRELIKSISLILLKNKLSSDIQKSSPIFADFTNVLIRNAYMDETYADTVSLFPVS